MFWFIASGQQAFSRRLESLSRLPSSRMLSSVDGQDDDIVASFAKVHGVWKPTEDRAPYFTSHTPKLRRVGGDPIDRFVQGCTELGAETRPAVFIPVPSFQGFRFGLGPKKDAGGSLPVKQLSTDVVPGDSGLRSLDVFCPASVQFRGLLRR